MSTYLHDPDATINYPFDWSAWLEDGETITASTWIPDPGITVVTSGFTSTSTTVKASVSVSSGIQKAINRITTSTGEVQDKTLTLIIEEQ